jgi:hypothetical protein
LVLAGSVLTPKRAGALRIKRRWAADLRLGDARPARGWYRAAHAGAAVGLILVTLFVAACGSSSKERTPKPWAGLVGSGNRSLLFVDASDSACPWSLPPCPDGSSIVPTR